MDNSSLRLMHQYPRILVGKIYNACQTQNHSVCNPTSMACLKHIIKYGVESWSGGLSYGVASWSRLREVSEAFKLTYQSNHGISVLRKYFFQHLMAKHSTDQNHGRLICMFFFSFFFLLNYFTYYSRHSFQYSRYYYTLPTVALYSWMQRNRTNTGPQQHYSTGLSTSQLSQMHNQPLKERRKNVLLRLIQCT